MCRCSGNANATCASGSHPVFNGETAALKNWLAVREKMNVPPDIDSLFVSEQRKPLNRGSIWYLIKGLAREAGLEGVRVHSLRHSTGYDLTNEVKDLRLIQDFMRHSSVQSTIRYTCVNTKRYATLFQGSFGIPESLPFHVFFEQFKLQLAMAGEHFAWQRFFELRGFSPRPLDRS
jgi:hypothetical protein